MEEWRIERLDHLGIVAGIIDDLGIVNTIDARIGRSEREEISTGEAVKAMIINGLGFSDRPLSLTPQFYENKAIESLFRPGVSAEHFNRFKLGRAMDAIHKYGSELLFSEIALKACQQEKVDNRFNHLDTSSFSLTSKYLPHSDEHASQITHGYSKDHRPDLKQAVLEIMVSSDGGVPTLCKSWSGNSSDNKIFEERSRLLLKSFKEADSQKYFIADSKLYTEDNAANLKCLNYITRIPNTIGTVAPIIRQALASSFWISNGTSHRRYSVELCHYQVAQRWIVVDSEEARSRSEKTISKAVQREKTAIQKQLFHLKAMRFESQSEGEEAVSKLSHGWKYHIVSDIDRKAHSKFNGRGRPSKDAAVRCTRWQIALEVEENATTIRTAKEMGACYVLGTNIPTTSLSDEEVIRAYKKQSSVERGFRFLKDPIFFTSSLFLKKASRIEVLLFVMTVALLVYSIAERRLRKRLAETGQTIPNQIKQPTQQPTLRWVFQLLDGSNCVMFLANATRRVIVDGLNALRTRILTLLGDRVCSIYQIAVG